MAFPKMKIIRLACMLAAIAAALVSFSSAAAEKPNLIFILADDLGYGDLGCYGQEKILTPHLDQMAAEGMRFTDFYAGSTVCAPSRCVLMTGKDTGHCWVRGNSKDPLPQTLPPQEITVAEVMQDAGYRTALFGKWGLGELGSTGHPNDQGFDEFFGYLNQRHAHNYFPEFLIHNKEIVPLRNVTDPAWTKEQKERGFPDDGAGWALPDKRIDYTHDLIVDRAMGWLDQNHQQPFFLFLPFTIPHANNEGTRGTADGQEISDHGIYSDKPWPAPDKGQAAMITHMDADIGRLLERLQQFGIDENTLVIFSSDNGHHKEGGNDPELFDANGPLRGMKRALYEGGIRVPTIARWPGTIAAGKVSDHRAYFGDLLATAADLAGQPGSVPEGTQSISFLPTLKGDEADQKQHSHLYWEFYEQGSRQAVRFGSDGKWKAIRQPMLTGKVELYDLSQDLGEENDLAESNPDLVAEAVALMESSHQPDPKWQVPVAKGKK
jgi:uncharacterized sulfatase